MPRTIDSFEDFIINDLLPGMGQNNFVRAATDQLRLATSVSKLEPTYLSKNADHRQAIEDLITLFFRPTQSNQTSTIYVIIVREVPDDDIDNKITSGLSIKKEEDDIKPKIKKEKNQKKEGKIKPNLKVKSEVSVRQASRKRSFSVAEHESETEIPDLLSPETLLQAENLSNAVANRTRHRHVLEQEDFDRAAQYGI
jgi:hypothetical protein